MKKIFIISIVVLSVLLNIILSYLLHKNSEMTRIYETAFMSYERFQEYPFLSKIYLNEEEYKTLIDDLSKYKTSWDKFDFCNTALLPLLNYPITIDSFVKNWCSETMPPLYKPLQPFPKTLEGLVNFSNNPLDNIWSMEMLWRVARPPHGTGQLLIAPDNLSVYIKDGNSRIYKYYILDGKIYRCLYVLND